MASSEEITSRLGLRRPFDTYAPRTQRRYRKAYAEGVSAKEVNKREYQKRRQSNPEKARRSAAEIRRNGGQSGDSHSPAEIQRLGKYLGWKKAAELLAAQESAIAAYKAGNSSEGNNLVAHMGDFEPEEFGDEFIDLAPYVKYHGKA